MSAIRSNPPRRLLVPEVIQTSAMDCGPAALKCLLEGFGIHASYGRLREACQTDVDGTSIDTLEEAAVQLGLDAEQTMLPPDHLLLPEARALPALLVVRLPTGLTHFVVAWRRHGRFLQVMDPATGRRWPAGRKFLDDLYLHTLPIAAEAWREWAGSDEFGGALKHRLAELGLGRRTVARLVAMALADPDWRPIAALDSATRMVDALVRAGGLRGGAQAGRVVERLIARVLTDPAAEEQVIPGSYWSVRPAPAGPEQEERLLLRGAVLIRVLGRRSAKPAKREDESTEETPPLSPELAAALKEPPSRPGRELFRTLRADGLLTPVLVALSLALASGGVVLQALLLRGLFDLHERLGTAWQRLGAMVAILAFLTGLMLLELPVTRLILRMGRRLEVRLRLAFLDKIPRLSDRYFQSRPISDMAERSHRLHELRLLPDLGAQFLRALFELTLTAAGIAWLDPAAAPVAALAAVLAVGLPLMAQPTLAERDLRVRTHLGALARFYLDAMMGLIAVRVHGARKALQREQDHLLLEWGRAGLGLQRTVVSVEGAQWLIGFALVSWLVLRQPAATDHAGTVLLLVYWALNLPVLGQRVAMVAWQYPHLRNITLRLLEPLGAADETSGTIADEPSAALTVPASGQAATDICLEGVTVRAAGHTILQEVDLAIGPGEHVAIVGPSGAGKSSLVGLLLGWHRPAGGRIVIDGQPLNADVLERLRRHTVWVDPTVQLWNRSLLENLHYGLPAERTWRMDGVLERADLRTVLEKLPEGLQTQLGEGGGLVSGGEGQRVRLGRGMLRGDVRLVVLDEPFRGLDHQLRRELLSRARALWREATLLCITHDIADTASFERVLVVEGGRVVEDGAPADLTGQDGSRYRALLNAETAARESLWQNSTWRRLRLEQGCLLENGGRPAE